MVQLEYKETLTMKFSKKMHLRRSLFAFLAVGILTVFGSTNSFAQSGSGIPILVLGEDSDPHSVPRSSDIYRRVLQSLSDVMSRHNYYVIDEVSIAADLGWKVRDRRPRVELFQVIKLANQSDNMSHQTSVAVIFKLIAKGFNTGFGTQAIVHIDGDIIDSQSGRRIGGLSIPDLKFPMEAGSTIQLTVANRARDVAAALGDALRRKLKNAEGRNAPSGLSSISGGGSSGGGLAKTYTFTFRNFTSREIYGLTDVMEKEFTGYVRSREPQGDSMAMRYGYVTTASGGKLMRWINLLLMDSGLDPDNQVKVTKRGTKIEIDKLFENKQAPVQKKDCKFC